MSHSFWVSVTLAFGLVAAGSSAHAQVDPPSRVGRLAFVAGTVSFHDRDQTDWAPAVANTPLTSGDALWTEPNSRSEISLAGTRVRMDSGTQLDMLAIDDTQTRMQLDQGRIDIKTFTYDTHQPYEILTPRGTITLQQQGDYYVEAGSTQDPTRLGVRAGAAQIQAPNGQVLAVRAGEVGEIFDDNGSPQLRTIPSAPPPMPAYWAERDRVVVYDQPPQYVTAGMTGYEDLNYYGTWSNDPDYGYVWAPRVLIAGWEPYRTGHWAFVQPWGWTWVDDQPWGFAPYHYGRWAHRGDRWLWVPPQRDLRPVYAPALVAFVGGVELGVTIGQQSRAPVGWFPLGPREAYVPPYSSDRDYYRRVNLSARVQEQVMEDRWQRAQRREAIAENQERMTFMNRRFATVVPAEDFAHSRPVARVAMQVPPERLAIAPVAPVAAPPAPTQSIRAVQAPNAAQANRPPAAAPQVNLPTAQTHFANMQAIGRPEPATVDRPKAPGPQIATTRPNEPTAPNTARPGLPQLAPRTGAPPPQLQGERMPAPGQPAQPAQPGTPPKPGDNRAVTPPLPGAQPPAGQPRPPGQANLPPVREPNANRPVEPPKAGEPPRAQQPQHPAEQPSQATPPPLPPRQGQAEPPKPQTPQPAAPPQPQHAAPVAPPVHPVEPPRPQQAQQPAAPPPPAAHQAPPPQQSQAPPPPVQHQAAPPPPAAHPAPPPQQSQAPPPVQHQAAPPPPPQHQAAPAPAPQPPPQARAPAPPPPQAAHPAPPPQQAPQQAHAPPPQPQPQKPAPPPQGQKQEEKK